LPRPSPPQAVPPASRNSTAPSRPQSDASGASGALLEQARNQRAAGNTAQATASIERALRLDPNNAELWVERGELALQTGSTGQAATMARKALSLAGSNSSVSARAQRLLQAAGTR
jgi:Flp pilus assembly protein TadD